MRAAWFPSAVRRTVPPLALACLALAGCTIVRKVDPLPPGTASALCVRENMKVWSHEFLPILRDELAVRGIATSVYQGDVAPDDCRYHLEYVAHWTWDMATYLSQCDLQIFDQQNRMVARAVYNATRAGLRLDKFGRTRAKVAALLDELVGPPRPGAGTVSPSVDG